MRSERVTKMVKKGKKPTWVVEKEREKRGLEQKTVWLFGHHAVSDALRNTAREKLRLILSPNAAIKLAEPVKASGMTPEIQDPRKFKAPIEPQSVHQGAALEVRPLHWGSLSELCAPRGGRPVVLLLDRITDPHNVGAILRSAEVFGARAVIAPYRHSAPETGTLAKTASGALERQPFLRIQNLAKSMKALKEMGYFIIGLDGLAKTTLAEELTKSTLQPIALALGAEGPGLRPLTRETCDIVAKIHFSGDFGSLNVSNAAAVGLYEASRLR
tara:strand:- start:1302 stop:2117 length:816 start_codon:yes stop_codon:yes gene_type:complete